MEKKICVYAICKNELKFVSKWLDSMQGADYIVVLDTGSTDGTFEALKADSRVTRVEQKTYKKFRFDVARNDSMKLCPEDADILVCTDFDEVFTEGWADIVRDGWHDDDTRGYYKYAWSHNEVGEPTDIFMYDKMHNRNYHWIFPVHEVLALNDGIEYENQVRYEDIMLHHYQDKSKGRTSYLDLLKLSVKENQDNPHCQYLLAREMIIQELGNKKAIEEFEKILEMPKVYTKEFILVLLDTYAKLGMLYKIEDDYNYSLFYYQKFILTDRTYREPYLGIAEMYIDCQQYEIAYGYIKQALKETTRKYNWVEQADTWVNKVEDLRSICRFYTGDIDGAIEDVKASLSHNPDDIRMLKNLNVYLTGKVEQLKKETQEEIV